MSNGYAALGKARRNIIKRKKQTGVVTGALGALGTVASFGIGQAKKAKTAWGEYEAGYKELGGDVADIKKPGFFKRTAQQFLPGGKTGLPEGEIRMGATMYDRKQIQKAGSFLRSDAAAILSDEQRQKYLGRTAPGRDLPTFTKSLDVSDYTGGQTGGGGVAGWSLTGGGTGGRFSPVVPKTVSTSGGIGVGTGFGQGTFTGNVQHELTGGDFQPFVAGGERGRDAAGTVEIQKQQRIRKSASSREIAQERRLHAMPGPNVNIDFQSQIKKGFKDLFTSGWTGEGGGTGVKTEGPSQIPENKYSYAEGGDFITNGPQEILVGDNPSGRERVTVKPLSSKNDAEFGRYGDDAMKMIDGQPAHIDSSIEGDMSPEDIKKYGAGTINPITGKKEYFLGAIATGLAIGSSLYKGYQAMQNKGDVEAGKTAAYDIQQQQLDFLGEQKGIAGQTAELGFDVTQSQLAAGARTSTMGAQTAMRGVQAGTTGAISQSGLATSGTIEQKAQIEAGDVTAKLKSDMTKIFETRELAEREKDISLTQADLSYRKGEVSADDVYQSTLTGLESAPTTFLEGVFS